MVEENIICIGCPLGCRTRLRIDPYGNVVKVTGYKCKEGRQYVLEEYRNPVRVFTTTVLTQDSIRPLLPIRTDRPLLKTQLKEASKVVARIRVQPPVKEGQIILKNLMNTGVNVIATDDLLT